MSTAMGAGTDSGAGGGRFGRRRAARDEHVRGRRARMLLLAVGVTVTAAAVADALLAAPLPPARPAVAQGPATAGTWYCPSVAGRGEQGVLSVTAVGSDPTQVTVEHYADGPPSAAQPETIAPGERLRAGLRGAGARRSSVVHWSGGPAVARRQVSGRLAAAASCIAEPSQQWYATGFDTTLGSESHLFLFNPFPTDAVVRLVFATADGPVPLALTDNLLVEGGRTTRVDLRRFQPEVPNLGVTVEVLAGRVVAQGQVRTGPASGRGQARGRSIVAAAPAAQPQWWFADAQHDPVATSWLSVMNPGEVEAAVEITVTDPAQGGGVLGEVSVPAGGVARIELAEASSQGRFGVSVATVNNQPVVVSRVTAVESGANAGALAVALGTATGADRWALSAEQGAAGVVALYNPGPELVVADVDAGAGTPVDWSGIDLDPNARVSVSTDELDAPTQHNGAVTVTADGPMVAEMRSVYRRGGGVITGVGVPAAVWRGPPLGPAIRYDAGLATSLDTPSQPAASENP